jgi:trk system potassium uptake protein TrkA
MRVTIAGAGAVGRSIATELLGFGHQVMLIERDILQLQPAEVEAAEWVLADACELASLEEAGLERSDAVIAATGDDKVNLVVSLLAKTEFAVRRETSGCSPRLGGWTWRCRRRGCSPPWSRKRSAWVIWCG